MCGHDSNETSDDDQRPRSILGRLARRWPRATAAASAISWAIAVTILILHTRRDAFRSDMIFGLNDIWLISLGSVGAPSLLLGLLGRHLTTRACETISVACFTLAGVLTVLVGLGYLPLATTTAEFTIIPFIALAIQSVNGAYALDKREAAVRRARAEERAKAALALAEAKRERDAAVEDAHFLGIARSFQAQHARTTEISNVLSADTEDLSAAFALLREELDCRRTRRVVNGHNGRGAHNGSSGKVLRLVTGKQDPHTPSATDRE